MRRVNRRLGRWVIPIGGGLVSAALIAFLDIAGQSAAYLWSSRDQGT